MRGKGRRAFPLVRCLLSDASKATRSSSPILRKNGFMNETRRARRNVSLSPARLASAYLRSRTGGTIVSGQSVWMYVHIKRLEERKKLKKKREVTFFELLYVATKLEDEHFPTFMLLETFDKDQIKDRA